MNEEKPPERAEPLDVGFKEDEPRIVNHQYELDRLFREWHSARDNEVALRKGRALVSKMMSWIRAGDPFTKDDLAMAKDVQKEAKVVIKTSVQQQGLGSVDEHYKVTWDSYTVHVREASLGVTYDFVRREAIDVKLDAQADLISELMALCEKRKVMDRDYRVGLTPQEKMERGISDD